MCCVSIHFNPMTEITAFIRRHVPKISIWSWRNPKDWPYLLLCCVFHTISTQWLQIMKLFGVVFPKYEKMTSTDLGNQCFKTFSWIPLTLVKCLLLNSALLEIRIPAQLLIVHMQVQYWTNFGIYLQFAESTYICGFRLYFAESIYSCGIQNN